MLLSLQSCRNISDTAAGSSPTVAVYQMCTVIERTVTTRICLPACGESFPTDGNVELEQQRQCLRQLLDVSMQYVSCCKSRDSDRGMDAAQSVTMGMLLAVAVAVLRVEASDKPSPLQQILCGKADSLVTEEKPDQNKPSDSVTCSRGHALQKFDASFVQCDKCSTVQEVRFD